MKHIIFYIFIFFISSEAIGENIDDFLEAMGGPPTLKNPIEGDSFRDAIAYVLISKPNNDSLPIKDFYRVSNVEFSRHLFRCLEKSEMVYTPGVGLYPPRYIFFFSDDDILLVSFQYWFSRDRFQLIESDFRDGILYGIKYIFTYETKENWNLEYSQARTAVRRTNYLHVENFSMVIRAIEGLLNGGKDTGK